MRHSSCDPVAKPAIPSRNHRPIGAATIAVPGVDPGQDEGVPAVDGVAGTVADAVAGVADTVAEVTDTVADVAKLLDDPAVHLGVDVGAAVGLQSRLGLDRVRDLCARRRDDPDRLDVLFALLLAGPVPVAVPLRSAGREGEEQNGAGVGFHGDFCGNATF